MTRAYDDVAADRARQRRADTIALTLRLPRDLHGRMVKLAALQDRSLHSAIVAALRAHSAGKWAAADVDIARVVSAARDMASGYSDRDLIDGWRDAANRLVPETD